MVPPARCPYQRVEVRAMIWEDHNHQTNNAGPVHGADQELSMVHRAFQSYGYNVMNVRIPKEPSARSVFPLWLQNKLRSFTSPGVKTMIILYYQGHGGIAPMGNWCCPSESRASDDRGDSLSEYANAEQSSGNGQRMHWTEIANAMINVPADVLTILNCCHAGAAAQSRPISRPNYEAHLKQVMMAVPAEFISGWGCSAGSAACLEHALRKRRNNWENTFKGSAHHWMQAINRTMAKNRPKKENPPVTVVNYVVTPPNWEKSQIIVSPMTIA